MSHSSGVAGMKNFWQKAKLILAGMFLLYVVILIAINLQSYIDPGINVVFHRFDRPNTLIVLVLDSVISIAGWSIFLFLFHNLRQLRNSRKQNQLAKPAKPQPGEPPKAE